MQGSKLIERAWGFFSPPKSFERTETNHLTTHVADGCFYVRIGPASRAPGTPYEEAVLSAKKLHKASNRPLWLCMSGGIDSEVMALAFIGANVPFRVAIMRFLDGYNQFDIRHAVDFCRNRNLKYRFFDLDIRRFYETGAHIEYARKYGCNSPQIATHLHLIERIPGAPIFARNVLRPYYTTRSTVALTAPGDLYFSYHRAMDALKKPGTGFFLMHSPELVYSFVRLPLMQGILNQPQLHVADIQDAYGTKCRLYRDGGFDVTPRESKFTGFEELKKHYAKQMGREDDAVYDEMFRAPLRQIAPLPQKEFLILDRRELHFGAMSAPG